MYKAYNYAGGDDGITREELSEQVFDTPTEAWFSVGFSTHAHSDVAVEDTATGLPVSDSIFQAGKPKVTHITLPVGVLCCYIEMTVLVSRS